MKYHIEFDIADASHIGELRRAIQEMAKRMDLGDEMIGRLSIISNEMSSNIIKHSKTSGKVLIKSITHENVIGIEIICMDKGTGIKNMSLALKDGYSTAGSMGTGLGAIKRLSDQFDIYSGHGNGTIVVSKVWKYNDPIKHYNNDLDIGIISTRKPGQIVCGDDCAIEKHQRGIIVLITDGLGHGEGAAQASREAVRAFRNNTELPIEDLMFKLHHSLAGTRGAVASIALINPIDKSIEYAGVGNISARIISDTKQKSFVSYDGIVGGQITKLNKFTYEWPENSVFIMNTDGLISNINLDNYPGLLNKSASIISAVLYRDFSRGNDDTAIIAIKNSKLRWDKDADTDHYSCN